MQLILNCRTFGDVICRTIRWSSVPSIGSIRCGAMYARAVDRQYHIAQERERDLQSEYEAQEKQAISVSAALAQYLRLQSDLEDDRKDRSQIDDRPPADRNLPRPRDAEHRSFRAGDP